MPSHTACHKCGMGHKEAPVFKTQVHLGLAKACWRVIPLLLLFKLDSICLQQMLKDSRLVEAELVY